MDRALDGASHEDGVFRRMIARRSRLLKTVTATAFGGFLGACASPGVPPGGPERHTPPMITRIEPDTNSVNVRGREFIIHFDEVISERPAASVPTLADLVLVSPRDGQPDVAWHRDALTIQPRRRWRANTAYTVTLLPGIADLRGNIRKSTTEVTFSTGPRIPATTIRGVVFDALTGVTVPNALIEARPATDSTLVYVAAADSLGRFHMRGLQPMRYVVRGYTDQNRNRGLDPGEPVDSARVTLADSLALELLVFVHDSVGPRLTSVAINDSVSIRATFGTPLDPRTPLDPAHFIVLGSDSARIAVRSVAARPDTGETIAPPVLPAGVPQSVVPIPSSPIQPKAPPAYAKPTRPLLFRDVVIVVASKLQPGASYVLRAIDALGPTGRRLTSQRAFVIPKAAPPTDTTKAKATGARNGVPNTLPPRTRTPSVNPPPVPRTSRPAPVAPHH